MTCKMNATPNMVIMQSFKCVSKSSKLVWMKECMFNDSPAQNENRLLGVRQIVN